MDIKIEYDDEARITNEEYLSEEFLIDVPLDPIDFDIDHESSSESTHLNRHYGKRPFPCTMCEKKFASAHNLQSHMHIDFDAEAFITKEEYVTEKLSINDPMELIYDSVGHESSSDSESVENFESLDLQAAVIVISDSETEKIPKSSSKEFKFKNYVSSHIANIHGDYKPYCCEVCGHRIYNKSTYTEHLNRHYGTRPYPCTMFAVFVIRNLDVLLIKKGTNTLILFKSKQYVPEHIATLHHNELTKPNKSNSKAKDAPENKSETVAESIPIPSKYPCPICNKEFKFKTYVSSHIANIHGDYKPYCCEVCGRRFYNKTSYTNHLNRHYGTRPYPCTMCEKKFTKTKPDSVPCVVRTTTINRVEDKTEGQQYSSVEQQDLGEEFLIEDSKESTEDTENEKLLVHLGIASDHEISPNSTMPVATETIKMEVEIVNPVISDTATTSSESQVVSHSCTEAVANTNAHQNVCLVCEKVLSSKGNLKSHMSVHSDEKPFCCEVCGRRFAKKHNYNIHMLRHSGKRTHQCSLCDKSFVCSINLKNHMRIHSPTKPFACAFCGKKFTYLADKKHHEYSHTGDYPFCCKNCPRKFTKKHLFNRHLPVCMKKFEGMERPTTTRKQSRISDECSSKIKD
ncbi:zinc finger protein 585A-like [Anopheles nili]|uniref:zinc finger protein 585A-like n=1 Tax=Anopheles nili TaxID=185578 RepID=UPI00237C44CC|nr:zinc finger protein 585A-like [Anopheles nili]